MSATNASDAPRRRTPRRRSLAPRAERLTGGAGLRHLGRLDRRRAGGGGGCRDLVPALPRSVSLVAPDRAAVGRVALGALPGGRRDRRRHDARVLGVAAARALHLSPA